MIQLSETINPAYRKQIIVSSTVLNPSISNSDHLTEMELDIMIMKSTSQSRIVISSHYMSLYSPNLRTFQSISIMDQLFDTLVKNYPVCSLRFKTVQEQQFVLKCQLHTTSHPLKSFIHPNHIVSLFSCPSQVLTIHHQISTPSLHQINQQTISTHIIQTVLNNLSSIFHPSQYHFSERVKIVECVGMNRSTVNHNHLYPRSYNTGTFKQTQ